MKKLLRFPRVKHLMIMFFSFTITLMACGQDNKPRKAKIERLDTVNMKKLQEKEKKLQLDSLKKTKFETGPAEDTQSKPLPVPQKTNVKKTDITPGQMKKDSIDRRKTKG